MRKRRPFAGGRQDQCFIKPFKINKLNISIFLHILACHVHMFKVKMREVEKNSEMRQSAREGMIRRAPVRLPQTQLVGFHGRLTYVFAHEQDVGSIHFDRLRGEIFYKGHNIRHMTLEPWQWEALESLRGMLHRGARYREFAVPYATILDKIILEMRKTGVK